MSDSHPAGHHDHGHDHDHHPGQRHGPAQAHAAHGGHTHAGHSHDHGRTGRNLGFTFWLISAVMVAEAIGGYWSGSLTLTADAGHMFVDAGSLALAWFAHRLSVRPRTDTRSFGYARVQVLAAFVNSLLLLFIVATIVFEAIERLATPQPMNTAVAASVAFIGVLVNIGAALLLHGHHHEDMNARAAYLHVLSDLAGAVAAVAAALIVRYTGWLQADAWLSFVVAALIASSAWRLLRQSAHVLQESVPTGLDLEALKRRLRDAAPGVLDVHHVHVWSLTPRDTLLTAHARIGAGGDVQATLAALKHVLVRDFKIEHSTIQIELDECAEIDQHCADVAPAAHRPAA